MAESWNFGFGYRVYDSTEPKVLNVRMYACEAKVFGMMN